MTSGKLGDMTENAFRTDAPSTPTASPTAPSAPPVRPAAPAPDTPSAVITALWSRMQARDWTGVAALIAPDAVIDWPVSGERIPSRDAYVAVNAEYPEGWTVHEPLVLAQGTTVVSEVRVDHEEIGTHVVVSLWTVEDGLITSGREYWTMPGSDPAPSWRAHHVRAL